MSVENSNIIDFASIDNENYVVLTISDHLEWDSKNEHLLILQNKINAYLGAIESGDIYETYPKAENRNFIIRVVAKFPPNNEGEVFIDRAKTILENAGYGFVFEHLAVQD